MRIKLFWIVLTIVLLGFETKAQQPGFEREVGELMKKYEVPGLALAVVKDNKIVYAQAFGLKNIENKIPLQKDDLFRIASISKSFCATAILQLVEQNKLKLDDEVTDLIGFKVQNPYFPQQKITLRMLLSHTSSLNDSGGYFNYNAIDPALNSGNTKCYSNYEPGTQFKYCNLNYNLIGSIIEKASGIRFDEYVRTNIIKPLGIYAGYNVDSLDTTKFVSLYTRAKNTGELTESKVAYVANRSIWAKYRLGYSAYSFSPTGGMKISAPDLAKVMLMHLNLGQYDGVRILKKLSAEQMQHPHVETGVGSAYGYAIRIMQNPKLAGGNLLVGHTGSASGLLSEMFFNPKKKFGFVFICSGSKRDVADLPFEMRSVLADGINLLYDNFIK